MDAGDGWRSQTELMLDACEGVVRFRAFVRPCVTLERKAWMSEPGGLQG
jgi:hypothetical protein